MNVQTQILYSDKLIELSEDAILFHNYYFPWGDKKIFLNDIARIEIHGPSLWRGSWRIHGSGNLRTWYPCDWKRPLRTRIYKVIFPGEWFQIGFTVENPEAFEKAIQSCVLLRKEK
jgi:hypothetical protein